MACIETSELVLEYFDLLEPSILLQEIEIVLLMTDEFPENNFLLFVEKLN